METSYFFIINSCNLIVLCLFCEKFLELGSKILERSKNI